MQLLFSEIDKGKGVKDYKKRLFSNFLACIFARTEWKIERFCKIKDKNLSFWVDELMNYWVDCWVSLWVWGLIWVCKLVIGWFCELMWVCMLMSWWADEVCRLMSMWVYRFMAFWVCKLMSCCIRELLGFRVFISRGVDAKRKQKSL